MIVFNLKTKVKSWADAGLLTPEQVNSILTHEHQSGSKNTTLIVLVLSAFLIGIGTIAIVSANWHEIPSSVKLIADYLILMLLSWGIYKSYLDNKRAAFETLIVLFALAVLGTIGLNAQIFNLSGEWYEAGLLWSTLLLFIAYFCRFPLVPFVMAAAFLICSCGFIWDRAAFRALMARDNAIPVAVAYALPMFATVLWVQLEKWRGQNSLSDAFMRLAVATGVIGGAIFEWTADLKTPSSVMTKLLIPSWLFAIAAILSLWFGKRERPEFTDALLLLVLPYTIAGHLWLLGIFPDIAYAFVTVALFTMGAIYFARVKAWPAVNAMILFAGLRFLVLFFEAIGGLLQTGLALILSGILLILGVLAWRRLMPRWKAIILKEQK